jgi:intergrase/recombinase
LAWYEKLDLSKIDQEARYRIFYYLRTSKNLKPRDLRISPSTFYRILHRKQPVSDSLFTKLLQHLSEQEFASLVGAEDRLRAAGILRSNGMVDYSVAIEILRRSLQDPYLKSLLLKFVAEHFREDLRKLLSLSVYGVKMLWSEDFERFLAERKKRRKVRSQETLQYYKSIFLRYLEGKELSEQLIDYVVNHENRWLRNVFRHYIQYLYHKRMVSPETFGWIMEVVPSRGYKLDVRPYQISLDDVVKTVQYLKQYHERYYLVYRLMIEGGLRLSHAVHIVKTFNPKEVVEIPEIHLETPRLVCFNDKGFCRYYAGIRGSQKPCEWAYFSIEALELLKRSAGSNLDRRTVTRYAIRHGLLTPKTMRKVSWRILVQVMPREVARFIQSRFGELKISEARYEDLLSEADNYYPKYLEKLRELVYSSHVSENREQYTSSQ